MIVLPTQPSPGFRAITFAGLAENPIGEAGDSVVPARWVLGTVPVEAAPRRPGDPARLIAGSQRAKAELGWNPQYPEIEVIIQHAWAWRKSMPNGYRH